MGVTKLDKLEVKSIETRSGQALAMGDIADHIADAGDTTANPAAVTSSAPAAVTAAAAGVIGGATDPTAAELVATQALRTEFNKAVTDITNLRAEMLAAFNDIVALRASVATLETDGDAYTTKINAIIDVLEDFDMAETS